MKTSIIEWHDIKKELPTQDVCTLLAYYDFGSLKQIRVAYCLEGKVVEEIHTDGITVYRPNKNITMWAYLPNPNNLCNDISARSYDDL